MLFNLRIPPFIFKNLIWVPVGIFLIFFCHNEHSLIAFISDYLFSKCIFYFVLLSCTRFVYVLKCMVIEWDWGYRTMLLWEEKIRFPFVSITNYWRWKVESSVLMKCLLLIERLKCMPFKLTIPLFIFKYFRMDENGDLSDFFFP